MGANRAEACGVSHVIRLAVFGMSLLLIAAPADAQNPTPPPTAAANSVGPIASPTQEQFARAIDDINEKIKDLGDQETFKKEWFNTIIAVGGGIAAFFGALITLLVIGFSLNIRGIAAHEATKAAEAEAERIAKRELETEKAVFADMRLQHETQLGEMSRQYDEEFKRLQKRSAEIQSEFLRNKSAVDSQLQELFQKTRGAVEMYAPDLRRLEQAVAFEAAITNEPKQDLVSGLAGSVRQPSLTGQYHAAYQAAIAARDHGELFQAIAEFQKAQMFAPDAQSRIVAVDAEALVHFANGQPESGIDLLRSEVSRQRPATALDQAIVPLVAMMLIHEGQMLAKGNRTDEALTCFSDAVAIAGHGSDANIQEKIATAELYRGILFSRLAQPQKAIDSFRNVVGRFDGSPDPRLGELVADALLGEGRALQEEDRLREAIDSYTRLTKRFEGGTPLRLRLAVAKSYINRGLAERALGDEREAQASFDAVRRLFETAPERSLLEQVELAASLARGREAPSPVG